MAIEKNIQDALNKQINREFFSSHLYLSMAAYFETLNMSGFANWLKIQSEEERGHAMKFFEHIVTRGGQVELYEIDKPEAKWASPLAVFKAVLDHEKIITRHVNDLVDLSLQAKDHATHNFLQFFVDEQVEEEASAEDVLYKLELVKESTGGMYMLDRELGKRTAGA